MDRITKSLLNTFIQEQGLDTLDEASAFERFCNFCVVSKEYFDTFDVEDVSCGTGQDTGLDGIGVIVNGTLVNSEEEILDLGNTNGYLETAFVFIQSKTSSAFNTADIGTFLFGVKDFFAEKPNLPRNEFVAAMAKLQEVIFSKSALMTKGKPTCKLYYVTTGTWIDDPHIRGRVNADISDLKETRLFKDVIFYPVDADGIQTLYRNTKSKVTAEFTFVNKTVLPDVEGIKEAYLGVLPAREYVRIITDEVGNIRKSLFYDNVRDFQEYNEVNKEVRATLQSDHKARFSVLNNGVTLVARSLTPVGNKFYIEDYQIVNGCQTSHVLYNERASLTDNIFVPIKVIVTSDETITNDIIKATNRQTPVKQEELNALTDFEKKLEALYNTFEGRKRLFYERRSKQYNGSLEVEKVRIITRTTQIKAVASMFIDEAHRAGRYYGSLLKEIGERLFAPKDNPLPYYTSAFANYKLEYFFRTGALDAKYRAYRYHLLMVLRIQVGNPSTPPPLSSPKIEAYCQRILDILLEDEKALQAYKRATEVIDEIVRETPERDAIKTQTFTENVKKVALRKR